jgi:hypothetical protein
MVSSAAIKSGVGLGIGGKIYCVVGGRPDSSGRWMDALTTTGRPTPRNPGDAANLGIPQGFEIELDVGLKAALQSRTIAEAGQVAIHWVSEIL